MLNAILLPIAILRASLLSLRSSKPHAVCCDLQVQLASLQNRVVLVDVENVRGKAGFRIHHGAVLAEFARWARECGIDGRILAVIDHGSNAAAYHLAPFGMGLLFAGPSETADDVIVRCVKQASAAHDVLVVTADARLRARCRRAAQRGRRLGLVNPLAFLSALFPESSFGKPAGTTHRHQLWNDSAIHQQAGDVVHTRQPSQRLAVLEQELASVTKSLANCGAWPEKRVKRTMQRRADLERRCNELQGSRVVSAAALEDVSNSAALPGQAYSQKLQCVPKTFSEMVTVLKAGVDVGKASSSRESTDERMKLAERLRKRVALWSVHEPVPDSTALSSTNSVVSLEQADGAVLEMSPARKLVEWFDM
mmetsp:Transcript_13782/g.22859  ORF Transcript_13782/g.22859 Transcript_13782/m.22859 type:complete len:366 (+) Transcript_13782:173-1270(+)